MRMFLQIAVVCFVVPCVCLGQDAKAPNAVSFRKDVWPILKRHCWGCHSGAKPKGGLRVDTVAAMLKGGDGGPAYKVKSAGSLLLTKVEGDEPDMPPNLPPLSAAKIEVLRQWIMQGAIDDSTGVTLNRKVNIPEAYRAAPAVTSVAFSPDGTLVAAACRSEIVLLNSGEDSQPRRLPTNCDLVTNVSFSPDGKLLAASGGSPGLYGEVRFFSIPDGKVVSERRAGHDTLFRGGFSPDGKSISVGGADGAAYIIPVDSKAEIRRFELHSDWVFDAVFTPNGSKIVSGGRDKATKVTSVETGKLLRSVDASSEMIHAVAADDAFAISGGKARQLFSFDFKIALENIAVTGAGNGARPISKRNQYAKAFEGQSGVVLDLDTSDDHKRLAVAGTGSDVRIYTVADRARVGLIPGVTAPVYSVALNHDGSQVAIGTRSGLVEIYDVKTAKKLKSIIPVPMIATATVAK
ncbi:MAG: hypothetical protein O3A00_06200 [Planctomycetota bacterium]|nr:hypothetical protein [Planctomycetota bacterium]